MSETGFVTEAAKALIGRETTITFGVSEDDIKKVAIAIGDLNPVYMDPEKAKRSRYGGIIAHPMHWAVSIVRPTPEPELDNDGMPVDRDPPLNFSNRVAGGAEIEFFAPMRPGDTITATNKIVDIVEKRTSRGAPIAVVSRQTQFRNQQGHLVVLTKETTILIK